MPNLRFFDLETRSPVNLKTAGVDNYAADVRLTLVTWADGEDGVVHVWEPLQDPEPPAGLLADFDDTIFVAWNSRFDRLMWNACAAQHGLPPLRVEQVLDAAAQARATLLPSRLDLAAQVLGMEGKERRANMLYIADATQPLPDRREKAAVWEQFIEYGVKDTVLLRDIWYRCRPLSEQEWQEFIASEIVNDRGIGADLDLAKACLHLAQHEEMLQQQELMHLQEKYDLPFIKWTQTKQVNQWVYARLPEALSELMVVSRKEVPAGDGGMQEVLRMSLDSKKVLPQLIDTDIPMPDEVNDVLQRLQSARAKAGPKFKAIINKAHKGRLYGNYVFNGAGQTGRYSSWGVQMHNLVRKTAPAKLINAVISHSESDPAWARTVRELLADDFGPDISRALGQFIRPCLIAQDENSTLMWGDWSSIEARMLPWLADSPAAEPLLEQFRRGEDIYVTNAAKIFGKAPEDVDEDQRQAGKVAVLALGYGGAVGAYRAMARGYGMAVDDDFARFVVDNWRKANQWARTFWYKLWDAAVAAYGAPGQAFGAGRVRYMRVGPHLYCFLPCGRPLMYPDVKIARVKDAETGKESEIFSYRYEAGRRELWYGKLAENITQGAAASLMRNLVTRMSDVTVGHTHDEIILECRKEDAAALQERLRHEMQTPPAWADGVPLNADICTDWYYHKQHRT